MIADAIFLPKAILNIFKKELEKIAQIKNLHLHTSTSDDGETLSLEYFSTDKKAKVVLDFMPGCSISIKGSSDLATLFSEKLNEFKEAATPQANENKKNPEILAASEDFTQKEKIPKTASWIGTDESGKGDYFGPLVIAGVLVEDSNIDLLKGLNVRDSKKISDGRIKVLAAEIKSVCSYNVVCINPKRYNELYEKIANLNWLLAWGHARVLENILEKHDCQEAVADQFGDESFILNSLMSKGRQIRLIQKTGGEEDLAVAAASILARDEFLRRLDDLSQEAKMKLPKGASSEVITVAKKLVAELGQEKLADYAKLHFKTTKKII